MSKFLSFQERMAIALELSASSSGGVRPGKLKKQIAKNKKQIKDIRIRIRSPAEAGAAYTLLSILFYELCKLEMDAGDFKGKNALYALNRWSELAKMHPLDINRMASAISESAKGNPKPTKIEEELKATFQQETGTSVDVKKIISDRKSVLKKYLKILR